ncbi:unnamed protein product [Mytilus coruscus]|uniref:Uncharacterized protein n=1 Tax=Mytilus coruscus TaxID=42192 RepID=A0A6J8DE52_MYTCO|nr:unnamed protein product [Mytilus coruscus]
MPLPRSAKKLRAVVKTQVNDGTIKVGRPIAPKTFSTNTVTKEGSLSVKEVVVFGRKIPLDEILANENERIEKAASTDKDQMTYINARLEDIELLAEGTNYKGIPFNDKIRICSGDNPARQFESGQQRGGQYSCLCGVDSKSHINLELCFKLKACTLEERHELEDRHVNTHTWGKPRLQQELNDILHGISRPPALMTSAPEKSAQQLNLDSYEVMMCEQLHDLSNVIINFINELPHHADNNDVKSELEAFSSHELNERNQLKGADAQAYRIINAKSILTEDSERTFGSLKRISENTSNRKAGYIIENASIRYRAQEDDDDRADSSQKQESEISKLAKSLPPKSRTTLPQNFIKR